MLVTVNDDYYVLIWSCWSYHVVSWWWLIKLYRGVVVRESYCRRYSWSLWVAECLVKIIVKLFLMRSHSVLSAVSSPCCLGYYCSQPHSTYHASIYWKMVVIWSKTKWQHFTNIFFISSSSVHLCCWLLMLLENLW